MYRQCHYNVTMKTATLNVRLEPALKAQVHEILAEIGISTSEAIQLFFKRIVKKKGIPFTVDIPNKTTRKTIEDSRHGINVTEHKNVDELFKSLGV